MRGRSSFLVGRIQHGGNIFNSLGLDWCPRCRSEQDCDTDAEYTDGIYVYRRRCCRCGAVIKYGAYQVPTISDKALPPKAFIWCHEPGKDRR